MASFANEWRAILGDDPGAEHERWVNTFGNLTLTGYNSELSNRSFEEKRAHFEQSGLQLNRYFQKVDRWDVDAIKQRGEWLAEIAVDVWPH
ncbi:MAG: HNH endonuclease family protein [Salinibacter sp.]